MRVEDWPDIPHFLEGLLDVVVVLLVVLIAGVNISQNPVRFITE
jgi:hypothetical protein